MSFFLCHDCYTWVRPAAERCPECGQGLDLSASDPTEAELAAVIGELRGPVGEVRVRRALLPEYGVLYDTERGLFFVPHETHYTPRAAPAESPTDSLLWAVGGLIWGPLAFLLPILRARSRLPRTMQVAVLRPRELPADAGLSAVLMDDPGAFFLPRAHVRQVHRRGRGWSVARQHPRPFVIAPLDDAPACHVRLGECLASDGWRPH
jgi:hypothetical protein